MNTATRFHVRKHKNLNLVFHIYLASLALQGSYKSLEQTQPLALPPPSLAYSSGPSCPSSLSSTRADRTHSPHIAGSPSRKIRDGAGTVLHWTCASEALRSGARHVLASMNWVASIKSCLCRTGSLEAFALMRHLHAFSICFTVNVI